MGIGWLFFEGVIECMSKITLRTFATLCDLCAIGFSIIRYITKQHRGPVVTTSRKTAQSSSTR